MPTRDDDPHDLSLEVLPPSADAPAPADLAAAGRPPSFRRTFRQTFRWVAGLVLVAAGLCIGLAVLAAVVITSPDQAETVTNPVSAPDLRDAGFTGAIGGSLAHDAAVVNALRMRVVALAPAHDASVVGVRDVLILWAGDLNGRRYAVTTFREAAYGWSTAVLTGAAGIPADRLSAVGWVDGTSDDSLPAQSGATFLPGVVFVVAPVTHGVEIATDYLPEGRRNTSWRPLRKQGGMVWVGLLDPAEQHLAAYRTEKPEAFPDPAPVVVGRDAIIETE